MSLHESHKDFLQIVGVGTWEVKYITKHQKNKRARYLTCIAGAYPKCFHNYKDYKDDPVYKKAMEGYCLLECNMF